MYTKGKWGVEEVPDDMLCIYSKTPNGFHYGICNVLNGIDKEANAHLIAAAPDMYEALKDCITSMQSAKLYGPEHLEGAIMTAQMALSKAEGKDV